MLIFMCALHCEAKPIIDFYRLKKSTEPADFDLYFNGQIACIVSGMGGEKMTAAVAWAINEVAQPDSTWINLGIAGHRTLEVGSMVLASKVSLSGQLKSIQLNPSSDTELTFLPVITQQKESVNYIDDAMFDMEAYPFIKAVLTVTPNKNALCIKIISDNQNSLPTRNKAQISDLIARHMTDIDKISQQLITRLSS